MPDLPSAARVPPSDSVREGRGTKPLGVTAFVGRVLRSHARDAPCWHGGTRTPTARLRKPSLYPLSYAPLPRGSGPAPGHRVALPLAVAPR